MEFLCKGCGKRKRANEEWLLVFELVKPGTEIRKTVILAEWDDKLASDPRAMHFCHLACQKAYIADRYARELVAP